MPHANNEGKDTPDGMEVDTYAEFDQCDWLPNEKGFARMVQRIDITVGRITDKLEELGSFIQAEEIDLDVLSNPEVRQLLTGGERFEQIDTGKLAELMSQLEEAVGAAERVATDATVARPNQIDSILTSVAGNMPHIFEQQDFGDLTDTGTVRVKETGETAKVERKTQQVFDRAVKRRNVLNKLLECISG